MPILWKKNKTSPFLTNQIGVYIMMGLFLDLGTPNLGRNVDGVRLKFVRVTSKAALPLNQKKKCTDPSSKTITSEMSSSISLKVCKKRFSQQPSLYDAIKSIRWQPRCWWSSVRIFLWQEPPGGLGPTSLFSPKKSLPAVLIRRGASCRHVY